MFDGYVRSYRRVLKSDLWQNHNAYRVFQFLLLRSMYRPHKYFAGGRCIDLQPGQFISSSRVIARECGLGHQATRSALDYLKLTQRVTQEVTRHYTTYSIVKWDEYQNPDDSNNTAGNTITNTPITHRQHTDNTLVTQEVEFKKVKKVKNVRKDQNPFVLPDAIRPEVWEAFEEHRNKLRKPMTDTARRLMVKSCEKIGGDLNNLLEHAILRGWQTVFPIREGDNGRGTEGKYGQRPATGGPTAIAGKYDHLGTGSVATPESRATPSEIGADGVEKVELLPATKVDAG